MKDEKTISDFYGGGYAVVGCVCADFGTERACGQHRRRKTKSVVTRMGR